MSLALIFIVALLERLVFARAWSEASAPASAFYAGDARAFVAYATHLVEGRLFDNGVPFHPPGWPVALALFDLAARHTPVMSHPVDAAAVKGFVAVCSSLAVVLSALAANRVAGPVAMILVALLGSFHFGHLVQGTVPTSEALYSVLVGVVLVLAPAWLGGSDLRSSRRRAAALGAAAAFGTLVRPEFALAAAGIGALRWRTRRLPRADVRGGFGAQGRAPASRGMDLAIYITVFALVLLPGTVWNWRNMTRFNAANSARLPGPLPRFAPVTSYGAFNFASANHSDADGGPNLDHPILAEVEDDAGVLDSGALDLAHPAVHRLYVDGWRIGLGWMLNEPRQAAALIARKLEMASGVFALGYLHGNVPAGIEGTRRRVDMLDPRTRWLWMPHVILIVAGAVASRRRTDLRPLLVIVLTLIASIALFYGYVRLAAAYLPAFWILQGAAMAVWVERWRGRLPVDGRRVVLGGFAVALVLLALELRAAGHPQRPILEGPRDANGRLMQDETIEITGSRPAADALVPR